MKQSRNSIFYNSFAPNASLLQWQQGHQFYNDDIDEAVYGVVQVGRNHRNVPVFQRLRQEIQANFHRMRQAVLPSVGSNLKGVWVEGSRGDAVALARRLGLQRITQGERHRGGAPHIHGYAGRRRSEHIFYGNRPPNVGQNFFD